MCWRKERDSQTDPLAVYCLYLKLCQAAAQIGSVLIRIDKFEVLSFDQVGR